MWVGGERVQYIGKHALYEKYPVRVGGERVQYIGQHAQRSGMVSTGTENYFGRAGRYRQLQDDLASTCWLYLDQPAGRAGSPMDELRLEID